MAKGKSFWAELKERRVVRVALLYLVVGWGVVEIGQTVTDILALPFWAPRLVLVLVALGLPITLVLAWAFDVTPEGVQAVPSVAGDGGGRFVAVGLVGLAMAMGLVTVWTTTRLRPPEATGAATGALDGARGAVTGPAAGSDPRGAPDAVSTPAGTVAVLPLENRSSVAEQQHWVDGVHEELIIQLSKIEDLVVTNRASVMPFADGGSVRDIGRALGVAAVVQGGVERVGDRMRMNVQMVDVETEAVLFGNSYDEVLTTERYFEIRSELTLRVAEELHAVLTPAETRRVRSAPTDNLAAYDLVLRGRQLYDDGGPEEVETALELFAQATRLQPDYAEAWAWLSMAYNQRAQKGGFGPEMRDSARVHARHALTLDPEEAIAYRVLGEYERALELRPNWETPLISLSAIAWWERRHVEGIGYMARGRQIAPNDAFVLEHLADHTHYLMMDDEFEHWWAELVRVDPDFYWIDVFDAAYATDRGEFERAEAAIARVRAKDPGDPQVPWLEMRLGLLERDPARVERAARDLVTDQPDWDWWGQDVQSRVLLAWAMTQSGRTEGVEALLAEARRLQEARTGRRGLADPQHTYAAAQGEMVAGDREGALTRLAEAVEVGFPNLRFLRRDPIWDPVRDDPRFIEAERVIEADLARQRDAARELLRTIR